ncbi:PAAR domain-containing protein [Burkholderia vietnamiensis]|uniref:PAAR domain-containing protein n=1 Tax=Burkholderia vietnamiensis TaxID=60552 RepID=UPI0009C13194|nr:PAAR domain-containing protein [Burkholderia vietnamiensis]
MKSPIRKGDKLEHGGEVTAGSPWTTFMSQPLARKGDAAHCNLHGSTWSFVISCGTQHSQ